MKNTAKNFTKEDQMRDFRIIITSLLGIAFAIFTYMGIINTLSNLDLPIIFKIGFFFPSGVFLSCMLVGIFVEENKPKESRYIQ